MKKTGRRMIGTRMTAVLVAGIMMVLAVGCGSTKLSEQFDEAAVKSGAENVIDSLSAGDYDGVVETFSADMKTALPADKLEESVSPVLEKAGAFQEYKSESIIGQNKNGTDMAVAVIVAKYADSSLTYTITYSTDMEVVGLYVK